MVPSRSRSPKRSCSVGVLGQLVVGDADDLGDDDRAGRQLGIRPGDEQQALVASRLGAARLAEAVEVAAVRHEVELDPGALQLGEHHVRIVVGEERPRQVDLDVVVDDAGVDGGGELGAQRPADTSRLDLVDGDRRDRVARPHGDAGDDDHGDRRAAPGAADGDPTRSAVATAGSEHDPATRAIDTKAASDHAQ